MLAGRSAHYEAHGRCERNVAQARLVVVTAYRADPAESEPMAGAHREIVGVDTARDALAKSVTGLTRERARYIEQRLVEGDPAQALLDVVGANPANLIVVGNRGLGADEASCSARCRPAWSATRSATFWSCRRRPWTRSDCSPLRNRPLTPIANR